MDRFKNYSLGDKLFIIFVVIVLTLFFIAVLYPCIFVVSASFSSGSAVQAGKVVLFPVEPTLEGYKTVLNTPTVWLGYRNSILYTVVGTIINLAVTMTAAYCLSRKDLPGRNFVMLAFTFTMFFSGGLIPMYIQVQNLKLLNTMWALILPGAISVYNLIVARTFIVNTIPSELLEASQIDGCSDIRYYVSIVLPLSGAIIAVEALFYAVGHWNAYFNAMIYLSKRELYPLTLYLREILMSSNIDPSTVSDPELQARLAAMVGIIKYPLIAVAVVPGLLIYPFVRTPFVKGIMIGSVKG